MRSHTRYFLYTCRVQRLSRYKYCLSRKILEHDTALVQQFQSSKDRYACQWKYYDYTPISIMQRNSHFSMKTDWPLILGTCLFQSYYLHLDDIAYVFNLKLPWHWRHNECDGVSNRQPLYCLLNCLFRRRSKNASKLRVTGRSKGQCRGKFFHLMTS